MKAGAGQLDVGRVRSPLAARYGPGAAPLLLGEVGGILRGPGRGRNRPSSGTRGGWHALLERAAMAPGIGSG